MTVSGCVGIDEQAGDLLDLGQVGGEPPPARAAVLGAPDAGEGAGVEPALAARHQGQRVDRLLGQARRRATPRSCRGRRRRPRGRRPRRPSRAAQSAAHGLVGVEAQGADDPAGEGQVRRRRRSSSGRRRGRGRAGRPRCRRRPGRGRRDGWRGCARRRPRAAAAPVRRAERGAGRSSARPRPGGRSRSRKAIMVSSSISFILFDRPYRV